MPMADPFIMDRMADITRRFSKQQIENAVHQFDVRRPIPMPNADPVVIPVPEQQPIDNEDHHRTIEDLKQQRDAQNVEHEEHHATIEDLKQQRETTNFQNDDQHQVIEDLKAQREEAMIENEKQYHTIEDLKQQRDHLLQERELEASRQRITAIAAMEPFGNQMAVRDRMQFHRPNGYDFTRRDRAMERMNANYNHYRESALINDSIIALLGWICFIGWIWVSCNLVKAVFKKIRSAICGQKE